MARKKTKVTVGTTQHDAWEEEFETVREEWNEYRLLDGGKVRVKVTPQKIYRLLNPDGSQRRTPDGDPEILVRNAVQVVATD